MSACVLFILSFQRDGEISMTLIFIINKFLFIFSVYIEADGQFVLRIIFWNNGLAVDIW